MQVEVVFRQKASREKLKMPYDFFGFSNHINSLMTESQRNLPRVRVTELTKRQFNSTIVQEFSAGVFFVESHPDVTNSTVTLMGLRSQRLFMQGERVLAILLNMVRSAYGQSGCLFWPF